MAAKNLRWFSCEVTRSRFSSPSGRPTSAEGNLMIWRWIWDRRFCLVRSIVLVKRGAFRGVVIMVVFTPRAAKSLVMSRVGSKWPCAIIGKKKT